MPGGTLLDRKPVHGTVITPADIPEENWRPGHRGVDLDASSGDPVRPGAPGVIAFAGVVAGTPTVTVDHGNGLHTTYEPVLSQVSVGDPVDISTVLGTLADAGTLPDTARRDAGLHWGAFFRDGEAKRYVDPMSLLPVIRIRLWR